MACLCCALPPLSFMAVSESEVDTRLDACLQQPFERNINSAGEDKSTTTHPSSCISIEIVLFFLVFFFRLLHKTKNVSIIQLLDGYC